MTDLIYALIIVGIGGGVTWRAAGRLTRAIGALLILVGAATALWFHPTRAELADETARADRLCQMVAVDLRRFRPEAIEKDDGATDHGGAPQRSQWAALAPFFGTMTHLCTAAPPACLELLEAITRQGASAGGALDQLARAISTRTTCHPGS